MTALLSNFVTAPRSYSKHQRHDRFARIRHDAQMLKFLSTQATRLSTTSATIFTKLLKYSAARIMQATSLSQIP